MQALAPHTPRKLHCPVTSKKGVIGIGVPKTAATQAAVTPAEYLRLVRSCPIFFGGSDREPQGSPVSASGPGTPTCSSCRPQLALGAVVVANRPLGGHHG